MTTRSECFAALAVPLTYTYLARAVPCLCVVEMVRETRLDQCGRLLARWLRAGYIVEQVTNEEALVLRLGCGHERRAGAVQLELWGKS